MTEQVKMTITEALAEIKTIGKRIAKKRDFVTSNLVLQGAFRDPMEREGGMRKAVKETLQSIADLESRVVKIRSAITRQNAATLLTIGGVTQTIEQWLIWRREISEGQGAFWRTMTKSIENVRQDVSRKGFTLVDKETPQEPHEVTFMVSPLEVANIVDAHELTLGELDGKLSLLNATTFIEF